MQRCSAAALRRRIALRGIGRETASWVALQMLRRITTSPASRLSRTRYDQPFGNRLPLRRSQSGRLMQAAFAIMALQRRGKSGTRDRVRPGADVEPVEAGTSSRRNRTQNQEHTRCEERDLSQSALP